MSHKIKAENIRFSLDILPPHRIEIIRCIPKRICRGYDTGNRPSVPTHLIKPIYIVVTRSHSLIGQMIYLPCNASPGIQHPAEADRAGRVIGFLTAESIL